MGTRVSRMLTTTPPSSAAHAPPPSLTAAEDDDATAAVAAAMDAQDACDVDTDAAAAVTTLSSHALSDDAGDMDSVTTTTTTAATAAAAEPELTLAYSLHKTHRRSWLTPFFGANEVEQRRYVEAGVNPCAHFAGELHTCLVRHDNSYNFCQTRLAQLERCLREFRL